MAVAAISALVVASACARGGSAGPPPPPDSMAAIGDSITQAFDACCSLGGSPEHSWSTGDDSADVVTSHYERILASNASIAGHVFNLAVVGAHMSDAPGQAGSAVAQGVEYVTISMGANDLCAPSTADMTDPAAFQASFQEAMTELERGLPSKAHIFVSSIPDIYQLWVVLNGSTAAQEFWHTFRICESMLSRRNSEENRQQVVLREREYNSALEQVCGQYSNCRFDHLATYGVKFTADQVSSVDYFHPSLEGQATLADVTWAASWWPGQLTPSG
jgi:hypothetical protein